MANPKSMRNLLASLAFTGVIIGAGSLYWYLGEQDDFAPALLTPTANGPSVVDVMVIFNQAADDLYNNDAATRINHLIDVSNQIYKDSGANLSLRLVHTKKINYEAGYDTKTAITHLTDQSHPAFEGLGALREQYGADLVVMMRPNSDDGYCGIAWIGGSGTEGEGTEACLARAHGAGLVAAARVRAAPRAGERGPKRAAQVRPERGDT